jgi:predicted DNA-binding transcriptional regulator YafY
MTKLDLILPDRIRRRIEALRSSVEVMTWAGPPGSVVSAEALTVLSQGCRDREEVRFDYERRDGERSARLVQPHQLVAAGRRWYLVAWDVRREEFRTFRVDRMRGLPTLAGVRFEPHALPADDAVSFVRDGMRAAIVDYTATVTVSGSADDVRSFAHWLAGDVESLDDGRATVRLHAEHHDWLAAAIAMLATRFDIELGEADERVSEQLTRAATRLEALESP